MSGPSTPILITIFLFSVAAGYFISGLGPFF